MEFPEPLIRGERLLLAAFLASLGAVSWLESRSDLAAALREGRPWPVWTALASPDGPPRLYLALYQPARRSLDVVYFPPQTRLETGRTLAQVYADGLGEDGDEAGAAKDMADEAQRAVGALLPQPQKGVPDFYYNGEPVAEKDPALAAKAWFERAGRSPTFWLSRQRARSTLSLYDRFRAWVELRGLKPGALRPAWLHPATTALWNSLSR